MENLNGMIILFAIFTGLGIGIVIRGGDKKDLFLKVFGTILTFIGMVGLVYVGNHEWGI